MTSLKEFRSVQRNEQTRLRIRTVLRDQRLFLGLSIPKFAEKANVVKSTYEKIESGSQSCSLDMLLKLVDGLDLTMLDFWELVEAEKDNIDIGAKRVAFKYRTLQDAVSGLHELCFDEGFLTPNGG